MDLHQNLCNLYHNAPPNIKQEGLLWYQSARTYYSQLARKLHIKPSKVLGVVAALSPFVSWPTQLRHTEKFIVDEMEKAGSGRFPGFGANLRTARSILGGTSVLQALKGPKVRAFYKNLIGRKKPITLDRHAISAAIGRKIGQRDKHTKSQLKLIKEAYESASSHAGIGNCDFQAVIWATWKGINHGRNLPGVRS
jgi:hypothetical protein